MDTTIEGRRVAFDRGGRGQALVLLHAFPFDRRFWRRTAASFQDRHDVVVPDFRGFGDSDLGPGGFQVADLADDVARLLDALGIDRAVVGGLSMGGYVALALAARHPSRLAGLVLCDTRAGADGPDTRRARDEGIRALADGDAAGAFVDRFLHRLLAPSAPESVRSEAGALACRRPDVLRETLAALRDRPDRRPELPAIRVPTLVVVGAEDAVTPPDESRSMADTIPGAQLSVLPGAGHLPVFETPAAFDRTIAEFLAAIRP